jgi:hypothetical protein
VFGSPVLAVLESVVAEDPVVGVLVEVPEPPGDPDPLVDPVGADDPVPLPEPDPLPLVDPWTTTVPCMNGWIAQMYANVPAFVNVWEAL